MGVTRSLIGSIAVPLTIFALVLLQPCQLSAQKETGLVVGVVTDPTGALVPQAQVSLKNKATGQELTGTTASDGVFRVAGVPVGEYTITVEKQGFRRYVAGPFVVQVGSETTINIVLQVGAVQEEVVVTGEVLGVQTTSATLGAVVTGKSITSLPLNGRNFTQLGILQAGTIPLSPGLTGASSITARNSFSVNGSREDSNAWILDGAVNQNIQNNDVAFLPTIDSIQEFKILTNSYSPQYGTQSGGAVNIVTKSGTNEFHGTVWEFLRNDVLDARNFFAEETERLQRNQFGFSVGGPIARNRTFFFIAYEGTRQRKGVVQATTVPTQAERGGDFSHLLPTPIIDPTTGLPFPGNIIPPGSISPVASALLQFYPLPNIPGAPPDTVNFQSAPAQKLTKDQVQVRVDHKFSDSDSLSGFWGFDDGDQIDPFMVQAFPTQFPGFPQKNPLYAQIVRLQEVHTFSSNVVNNLSGAFLRSRVANFFSKDPDPEDVGITLPSPPDVGLPAVAIAGFSGVGNGTNGPFDAFNNTYQIGDNISYQRGRHFIQGGFEARRDQGNTLAPYAPNGQFIIDGFFTGNALADFLRGQATVFIFPTPGKRQKLYVRQTSYAAYFNDDFRIHPNLTLNLGLRYDYFAPFTYKREDVTTLAVETPPTPGVPQSGTVVTVFPGERGLPSGSIYNPDRQNWAPRLGLAWLPFGRGSGFVVRSGYGIFYNKPQQNAANSSFLTSPFFSLGIFFASPLADPLSGISLGSAFFNIPIDMDIKTAYLQHWNLNLQYQLAPGVLFTAGYAGSAGRRLWSFHEFNQPIFIPGASNQLNADARRPFAGQTSLLRIDDFGKSSYNALQLSLEARAFHGLALNVAYTFSKSIDIISQFNAAGQNVFLAQTPQHDNCRECDRAVSNFDRPHRFVLSYIYELPFGKRRHYLGDASGTVDALLGGWQVQGIVTLQSGAPFNPRDFSDQCLLPGLAGTTCRPDLVGDPHLPSSERSAQRWFNTSAFQLAQLGQPGTTGRNILRAEGTNNFDFALSKRFSLSALGEGANLEFRAEFFNLFNRTQFGFPLNDASSANFGQITNTAVDPRQIQLALKLNW